MTGSDQLVEVLVEDSTNYIVRFTGGYVKPDDEIRFVRKDLGTDCTDAGVTSLSIISTGHDYGGVVYECLQANYPYSAGHACAKVNPGIYSELNLDGMPLPRMQRRCYTPMTRATFAPQELWTPRIL